MHRINKEPSKHFTATLMAIAAAFMFAIHHPGAEAQTKESSTGLVQLSVSGMPPSVAMRRIVAIKDPQYRFNVDSFFDITYEIMAVDNLGSSGLDGVRATSFNVDSFFDITYEIRRKGRDAGSWETEIVSMSLKAPLTPDDPNAEHLLRLLRDALLDGQSAGGPYKFRGHVTVLK